MFLTFLLNNKSLVVGLILIAMLAAAMAYIRVLKSEQTALVTEADKITAMLAESQSNVAQLQNNIRAQNTAIDKLKTEGIARVAKHAAEVAQSQATATIYKQQANNLLVRLSSTTMSTCDAANLLINEELTYVRK